MVRIEKDYLFEGPQGPAPLAALFGESSQLIIQHVMFDPSWEDACLGCTATIDELSDGLLAHLRSRDTAFALVSRAPLARIEAYRAKKGWTVPWYSSFGGDFNYDFHVSFDPAVAPVEYNYRSDGLDNEPGEMAGNSCFLRQGDAIYHTYSTYARGTDQLGNSYTLLDLTALGRQEDWEEPRGRAARVHGARPHVHRLSSGGSG